MATHIDSPNLRVRPISKRTKEGYLQVGVETYGGGIWHSWLDRDLSLAGRVVTADKNGSFASRLIKIDRPLLRIPTLAIHRAWCAESVLSHLSRYRSPKFKSTGTLTRTSSLTKKRSSSQSSARLRIGSMVTPRSTNKLPLPRVFRRITTQRSCLFWLGN